MTRFLHTVTIALLCAALAAPLADARGRNNNTNTGSTPRPSTSQSAPSRNPGGNNQPGNRPGGNNQPGNRPGGPGAPGHNHPGHGGPGHGGPGHGGPGFHQPAPPRPANPGPGAPWHHHRPTPPPPSYRPGPNPFFSTILGLAIGSTINYALNSLAYSNYNVTGYGSEAIYLTNVPQLNMYWPNATLYYANGLLTGSQFSYATPYYNPNRYNQAFSYLCSLYGAPYANQLTPDGGNLATWWGPGGQFITLAIAPIPYSGNYLTTLTIGQ